MSKAAELAALIGSQSSLSNRNLIINGAMTVNQRGDKTGMTGDDYQIDRFKFGIGSLGTWSSSQSTTAPDGFGYSLKLDCTTADASPAASDTLYLYTRFEGQNLQQIKKGTASAESLTLSFWCRCNKTGDIQVNLRDANNTRQVGATVTINSADTWEYKTITVSGDTTGGPDNDNGAGLEVAFWLNGGSGFTGGSHTTSFGTFTMSNRNASNLGIGGAVNDYWQITGVQLEVGDTATPFEHRLYGDELARCQRYYEKSGTLYLTHYSDSSSQVASYSYRVVKRATPTSSIDGGLAGTVTGTGSIYSNYLYNPSSQSANSAELIADAEL